MYAIQLWFGAIETLLLRSGRRNVTPHNERMNGKQATTSNNNNNNNEKANNYTSNAIDMFTFLSFLPEATADVFMPPIRDELEKRQLS